MLVQNAAYSEGNLSVNCVVDGRQISVPCSPGNRHYDELMRQVAEEGLVIADYVEPSE